MDVRHGEAAPRAPRPDPWADESDSEAPVQPLSAEAASALAATHRRLSPWQLVVVQALVGAVVAGLAWGITRQGMVLMSALVGVAAVVVPHALMAWGLRRSASMPGGALLAFFFWEAVKVGLAIAILVAAAWLVHGLSWPALLVALVVCLKVNLWALWWTSRPDRTTS